MGKFGYVGKLMKELYAFAMEEKVYWMAPLVIALLVLSFLIVASQSSAPFIYTLF
tara:strand:+ start:217 stop:381 length:165 start_codon:yes stop_codon:yes gene_type:complete